MKVKNISNVIKQLVSNDINAILINGDWGIGKTYAIKEFIKENEKLKKKKRIKIAYTSLFGKNSIDEVNTELYNIFNKSKKVLNIISSVVKLVNVGVDIGINLATGIRIDSNTEQIPKFEKKLSKQKKENPSLIIIDDFERKSDKITSNELLGYINSLINQGFKIVVLADLNKEAERISLSYQIDNKDKQEENRYYISKVNFSDDIIGIYKEKIFDRIYNITETPLDIVENLFGKNVYMLNEGLIDELSNNLRMAIKVNSLYLQIDKYIDDKQYKDVEKDVIMKVCFYAVKELMTKKYSRIYEEKFKNDKYLKYVEKSFENIITSYDGSLRNKEDIINAVNAIYLDDNYSLLDCIYDKNKDINIFQSCFYLSDKNKIKIIKKQYKFILEATKDSKCDLAQISRFIKDWYNYCSNFDLSFINKDKLFQKLYQLNIKLNTFEDDNNAYLDIVNEYQDYEKKQKKYDIKSMIENDDVAIFNLGMYHIYHYYKHFDDDTKKFIKGLFVKNKFYLQKMSGDMERTSWTKNTEICGLIRDIFPELKGALIKILQRIKKENLDDLSCKTRIQFLMDEINKKVV